MSSYAVGIDFGTESARALIVDCDGGEELGSAVYEYRNGVIDRHLPAPHEDVELGPEWALQDPDDYVRALQEKLPPLLRETGIPPGEIVGIGIDFTACT